MLLVMIIIVWSFMPISSQAQEQAIAGQQSLSITAETSARFSGSGFYCCSPEIKTSDPDVILVRRCNVQGGLLHGESACRRMGLRDSPTASGNNLLFTPVTAGTMCLIRIGLDGVQYPHGDNGTLTIDYSD